MGRHEFQHFAFHVVRRRIVVESVGFERWDTMFRRDALRRLPIVRALASMPSNAWWTTDDVLRHVPTAYHATRGATLAAHAFVLDLQALVTLGYAELRGSGETLAWRLSGKARRRFDPG